MTSPKDIAITQDSPAVSGSVQRLVLHPSVTLYLGDCRDILDELPQDAAVVTDPPYPGREDLFATEGIWEALEKMKSRWPAFVFWPCVPEYPCGVPDGVHVWHKSVPIHPRSVTGNVAGHQYERILSYGLGKKCEVFRVAAIIPNFAACAEELQPHPTQKPLALIAQLVERAKVKTIIDPYMGSGTTGISAIRHGRNFIGIERDPAHFETARRRIEDEIRGDLFMQNAEVCQPESAKKL